MHNNLIQRYSAFLVQVDFFTNLFIVRKANLQRRRKVLRNDVDILTWPLLCLDSHAQTIRLILKTYSFV